MRGAILHSAGRLHNKRLIFRNMGDAARHLEAVFKLLDIDNSGFIEEVEGMKVGKALGYSPVFEYWEELKKLDSDGDGKISLQEFLAGNAAMNAVMAVELKEKMEAKLANLKVQGGTDAAKLPALKPRGGGGGLAPLKPIGAPAVDAAIATKAKAAFEQIDKDHNGSLDKEEVYQALVSLCDEGDAESIGMLGSFVDQEYTKADRDLNGKLSLSEFTSIYVTFTNAAAVKK